MIKHRISVVVIYDDEWALAISKQFEIVIFPLAKRRGAIAEICLSVFFCSAELLQYLNGIQSQMWYETGRSTVTATLS